MNCTDKSTTLVAAGVGGGLIEPKGPLARPFGVLVALVLLVTVATAGEKSPLPVHAPNIPPPVIERIPVRIGLCLSPVLRGAVVILEEHKTIDIGHAAVLGSLDSVNRGRKHWDLGNAVAATLAATLRAKFDTVAVLENCSPNMAATGDLQAIVVAQLQDARVVLPGLDSLVGEYLGRRVGHVDLLFTIRSAAGTPSLTWKVSASGFAEHSLLSSEDEVAIALSAALRAASARLLADLSLDSMVRTWFESSGVRREPAGASPIARVAPQGPNDDTAASSVGKIAIVSNGLKEQYGMQTTQCLRKSIEGLDHRLQIVSEDEVRDAFFPWLEYDVMSTYAVDALIGHSLQERARQTGVEFVVFPTDAHSGSETKGPFLCGGGYGGAGCLGAAEVQRNSEVTASIWDLRRGARGQSLTGQGHAKDALIGLVLPIWIPGGGSTKVHACHELAGALLEVMHGDPQGRLEPISATTAGPSAMEATATVPLPEGDAADAGNWSDELSLKYRAVRWFPATDDIGNSRTFNSGTPGTLRLTDTAMMFDVGSRVGDPAFCLSFDEIAAVEYRTSRINGHIGKSVHYAVVIHNNGQVDSFAIVNLGATVRANTKAFVAVLQSKLRANGAGTARAQCRSPTSAT